MITRDPNKAYISDMLWLPKAKVAEKAIKEALQYWDVDKNSAVMRRLWEETKDHIICPREFIKTEKYALFPFPFVDQTPKEFPRVHIWVKNEPRDSTQRMAFDAFDSAQSGILNLACGKGKSFLALKKLEKLGCPGLIVVHNTFLMDQWVNEQIPAHVELPPGEKVGIVQGPVFDWEHPITVAMIHTLASRVEKGKVPLEFRKHFGAVFYDETHHLSAPVFSTTAPIIVGQRFGLTATDKRTDGTDFIYKYHLGDVFYTDLVQDIIPRIYFQQTPIFVDLKHPDVRDKRGELHIGKLRSFVGSMTDSNIFRAACIKEALDQGRKVLAVSHSKDQVINLSEMFPGSGLIIQETPQADRPTIVRKSQVTFAIAGLGFEGLDDDRLDTVFILLPFGTREAPPNDLQQVMGRIQRPKAGKNQPVVIIFDDVRTKPLHGQCNTMRAALKEWDKHIPGMPALTYQTLQVP